jgi:formylglycine-generating enzyme required for sulfatase activity
MLRLLCLACLLLALPAEAVTIEFVPVGDAGNSPDVLTNCNGSDCGSVPYAYQIGRFEVTNAQYAEFLNAVAKADPNGLYNASMSSDARGGITRSGGSGSYSYSVKSGRGNQPVVFVSFYDALRFANWLHNGEPTGAQSAGTTEDGAYTITPGGVAANSIARSGAAQFFLPTENEWYKAAYYDPALGGYHDYATGTDVPDTPISTPPPCCANAANYWSGTYALTGSGSFDDAFDYLTDVGAYALSGSPYGTFDQAGNVWEWNETISGADRGTRGGSWNDQDSYLSASIHPSDTPAYESNELGFRVATVPEPGPGLLTVTGALGLLLARPRRRA